MTNDEAAVPQPVQRMAWIPPGWCDNGPVATMDVLVVEDAPEYSQLVSTTLKEAGHRVRTATTIAEAEQALASIPPDLVVLDLTLPDGDGLDLCQTIREQSSAYILMLTGRDDEVDKLIGFRMGADDYVTKPFSPREFTARIEAMARRPRAIPVETEERSVDGIVVRRLAREVEIDGVPIELTKIEFDLLDIMTAHPRRVFTREQLVESVWGDNWFGDDHVVDVHVANLRKKIGAVTDRSVVRTVRGVGYGLAI